MVSTKKETIEFFGIPQAGTALLDREFQKSRWLEESEIEPKVETITAKEDYGRFLISPLEKGYGITLGNALRRVLLNSLPGAAVTFVKIEGVFHEFSTIPGVLEDTTEIILNLKKIRFRLHTQEPKLMRIEAKGEQEVKAKDVQGSSEVEVLNLDQPIATLTDKNARLTLELGVAKGKGYVAAENHRFDHSIGLIPIDSLFSPILKVNYYTEDMRVGQFTNYEKLYLEIWSDKSLRPEEALSQGASLLVTHFHRISGSGKETTQTSRQEFKGGKPALQMTIDDMDLSVRSYNCLKRADIVTVADLIEYSEAELMNVRNFGKKSLDEIKEKLESFGFSLKKEKNK